MLLNIYTENFSKSSVEAPITTDIVTVSLSTGEFPSGLKQSHGSHVRPLLKKSNLDSEVLKNCRAVSNIPFLSKVLENVVSFSNSFLS
jgi:hypothetical protein